MNTNVLIAFGFGWMVVAAFLGLYVAAKHDGHLQALDISAARNDLAEFHRTFDAYRWRVTIHAHGMLFSLSAVVVGLVLPLTGFGERTADGLIGSMMTSTVVWTLASLKRARIPMGLADLLFIGAIAGTALGVAANAWGH